jgi:hypothetical protein
MSATRWWATPGLPDNHNYVLRPDGSQACHLCSEIEPPLRVPTGDERTDRAAAHLVHGVRAHLDVTAKEWSQ